MSGATTRRDAAAPPHRGTAAPLRGLLPLAALLVAWQLLADRTAVTLPPPTEWITALDALSRSGELWPAVGGSLAVYLAALVAAVVVGTTVGAAIGASPRIDRWLTPTLDLVATIPGAALVPIILLLLGITRTATVAVVALAIVWPILLNTVTAVRAIPAVRLDMSRTLGLSTLGRWRKIILPSLMPDLLVGVRIASSLSLIVTVLADILGAGTGIGRLMEVRQASFDAAGGWGLLLIVGGIGYLASRSIGGLERFLLRHHPRGRR